MLVTEYAKQSRMEVPRCQFGVKLAVKWGQTGAIRVFNTMRRAHDNTFAQ